MIVRNKRYEKASVVLIALSFIGLVAMFAALLVSAYQGVSNEILGKRMIIALPFAVGPTMISIGLLIAKEIADTFSSRSEKP